MQAFSTCGERGLLFVAVRGLLIAVGSLCCGAQALGAWASVVVARGLSSCGSRALECRLSSCGARAYLLRRMWDLPRPGLEPMSPALAGGFLTTAPPGKSSGSLLKEAGGSEIEKGDVTTEAKGQSQRSEDATLLTFFFFFF